jgi:spore coat polysaccharide biosynthesis protein SpsF
MKSHTVAIVQARSTSSRFPGKMSVRLGEYTLLEWVLRRVCQSERLDKVVLATTNLPTDDALVKIAENCGVTTFRGDEINVLQRFIGAAHLSGARKVVRVCADNPFIDAGEIDGLIEFFDKTPCDYACNHMDRLGSGYADGFGAEILNVALLERIDKLADEAKHREHVTLYLWDHADDFVIKPVPAPVALAYPHLKFDVDIPADLEKLNRLVKAGVELTTPAAKIVEIALLQNAKSH